MTTRLFIAAALALAACRGPAPWPPEPRPIALGEEACRHCMMIIGDDRFAAEVIDRRGEVETFDDIGCMLTARRGADPRGVFVRAFDGGGFVRGDRAFVVRGEGIASPMGFGLAAFASREAALAEARRRPGAEVAPLSELLREGASAPSPVRSMARSAAPHPEVNP